MRTTIQQLEDLKEWSKDSTRYERRLAFRNQSMPGGMGTEAGTIPVEFDELSDREVEYYRTGPWSTREDYRKGQLVQPGPGRPGYGGTKKGAAKIVRIKEERKKEKIVENKKYLDKLSHPDAEANIERWGKNQGFTIDETWKKYRKLDTKQQSSVRIGSAPSYKRIPPEIFKKLREQFSKMSHEEFAKKLNKMGYKASATSSFTVKKVKERMSSLGMRMDPSIYEKKQLPTSDPGRLKKIDDYVKEFEKDYGRKPTAKHVRTALKEQRRVMPLYEAKYEELLKGSAQRVTNVQKDLSLIHI